MDRTGAADPGGVDWLTAGFEQQRAHLRGVAYRMLGSLSDAEDAVQEAWIRLHRTDTSDVENLGAWLTTVVARISLNMLRARATRREDPLEVHLPDPVVGPAARGSEGPPHPVNPEQEALVADSVGLALMVVLEALPPAERLAFVLHDVFAVPFDQIALLVERSPGATRQLASRARRRVQGTAVQPDADVATQRRVVDAFFAAARAGDFEALVAVLHPDVVLRADLGTVVAGVPATTTGAAAVATRARMFASLDRQVVPATVNGAAGVVIFTGDRPVSVMGFTVIDGRVAAIDVLSDPVRIQHLDLGAIDW
jgi:RNA polymerase sigma-70 factor (ECF subfamily)